MLTTCNFSARRKYHRPIMSCTRCTARETSLCAKRAKRAYRKPSSKITRKLARNVGWRWNHYPHPPALNVASISKTERPWKTKKSRRGRTGTCRDTTGWSIPVTACREALTERPDRTSSTGPWGTTATPNRRAVVTTTPVPSSKTVPQARLR